MTAARKLIPFDKINSAALARYPDLLLQWFPAGKVKKREFTIGNLNGDPGDSLSINLITGKWSEFNGGGDSGPDPISLYAALHHDKNRVAAARDLEVQLGLAEHENIVPIQHHAQKKVLDEDWRPQVPAPGDASLPNVSGWDHVFPHYSEDGELLRYTVRRDAHGSRAKQVLPITFGILNGETGWHYKHAPAPRHLFGLDRIAAWPDARVWVLFGEKKTVSLHALFPDQPVVSWTGGDRAVSMTDWTPLRGKDVTIWPDADQSGAGAADEIAAILQDLGCRVSIIDVSDMPEKWDAGNAIEDGWTADQIMSWVTARLTIRHDPIIKAEQQKSTSQADPSDNTSHSFSRDHDGIVPLGHDRGVYYYLSRGSGQVLALPASRHTKLELMGLASVSQYWQSTPFLNDKGGVNWDQAADHLMQSCKTIGIFDPSRIRGRGAWWDDGRAILHIGDRLIVDGAEQDLKLHGSRFVYECAVPLSQTIAAAHSTTEAVKFLKICNELSWERPIDGRLLAGWCVIAPICGSLAWRPSIWVTGGSGSGKSTLMERIIGTVLGDIAMSVQSKTTEAGIRQALGSDARPVIFDEAEAEDQNSKIRIQSVLDLVRQSSSEGGAEIVKGSQNQSCAKRYRIRSCFAFSSINVSLEHFADENRITVLSLTSSDNRDPEESARRAEQWDRLNRLMTDTMTTEWCAALIARSVKMMPIIRRNAKIFAAAVAIQLGNQRAGDQLGALLAGAYSLEFDSEITREQAEDWLKKNASAWTAAAVDVETDEQRLLDFLMQHRMRVSVGNNQQDRTVGELIAAARDTVSGIPSGQAAEELSRIGIKYQPADSKNKSSGVFVSTNHSALKRILANTPWGSQWSRTLSRLPGADRHPKAVRFAFGAVSKAVWVPMDLLDRNEEDGM